MVVIEMNPRVSRSSALASKATVYASCRKISSGIQKLPMKLPVLLFELVLITLQNTKICFEIPGANNTLTSSMKSVEVMEWVEIYQVFKKL